jgi:phosphatidylserine synthase
MGLTVVLFYTYVGVYGKNVDALNIILYFAAMAAAYIFSNRRLAGRNSHTVSPNLCVAGILCVVILVAVFSVYPPKIGLFQSPTV